MLTSILKYGFAIGSLAAMGFGVLRLIQDGPSGETVAAITFNTGVIALGVAAILHVIEERRPPKE